MVFFYTADGILNRIATIMNHRSPILTGKIYKKNRQETNFMKLLTKELHVLVPWWLDFHIFYVRKWKNQNNK